MPEKSIYLSKPDKIAVTDKRFIVGNSTYPINTFANYAAKP